MNDNYDDEYENDEEYEDYDQQQIEQSSNYYARPPITGNVIRDAGNRVKHAGKQAMKSLTKAFLAGLKTAIVSLITNPIFLAIVVIIIILALFWIALSDAMTSKATENVEEYILNSDLIGDEAKGLYTDRHSLLLLKLSEVNEIYDAFIEDKSVPGELKTAMRTKMGFNEVESKKATQYNTSGSFDVGDYNSTFKSGSDGIRDDERVKIITGRTANINTYKQNGAFTWVDGKVGGVDVQLVNVTVPVWTGSYGSQVSSTATLQVNSKIKDIVEKMFEDIYNDPSKPVINDVHCFRQSDGYSGHVFAAAVDINPVQNPMPGVSGNINDYQPSTNKLSMDANHPIVKIICGKYGWDWGGSWRNTKDYMHFSFMGG